MDEEGEIIFRFELEPKVPFRTAHAYELPRRRGVSARARGASGEGTRQATLSGGRAARRSECAAGGRARLPFSLGLSLTMPAFPECLAALLPVVVTARWARWRRGATLRDYNGDYSVITTGFEFREVGTHAEAEPLAE